MSVLISAIISQALDEISDQEGRRTKRPDMLRYFNRVQRVVATGTQALEVDAYFNLEGGEPRYGYPENAVQITGVRISRTTTPTSLDDYYYLDEAFRDDFRAATGLGRQVGAIARYIARKNWIELLEAPTSDITDGGLLTYCKIPTVVIDESQALAMELPDFMEDHVLEGMKIVARMTGRERVAANDDWVRWKEALPELKGLLEDRSADKRFTIAPPRDWTAGMR